MLVKELIKELKKMPQNIDVVLSIDEEGNGFKKVYELDLTKWDGEDCYHPDDWEFGLEWQPNRR